MKKQIADKADADLETSKGIINPLNFLTLKMTKMQRVVMVIIMEKVMESQNFSDDGGILSNPSFRYSDTTLNASRIISGMITNAKPTTK